MESLDTKQHLVLVTSITTPSSITHLSFYIIIDVVPNDGQHPPHKDHHQKYLLATGPMCRYACDLQPMLKVLAGHEHIHKLIDIHKSVRFSTTVICICYLLVFMKMI